MSRVPAPRRSKPEAIREPGAFLCSDLAPFMHGSVLQMEGGWIVRLAMRRSRKIDAVSLEARMVT